VVDYIVCYYISEYVLQCYNGVWSNLVEERKKICHWKIVPNENPKEKEQKDKQRSTKHDTKN
jgi:hypothetical protein